MLLHEKCHKTLLFNLMNMSSLYYPYKKCAKIFSPDKSGDDDDIFNKKPGVKSDPNRAYVVKTDFATEVDNGSPGN